MSVYLLGAVDVKDHAAYEAYQREAAAALAPFDVEFLAVDPRPVMLEGEQPAGHLFIIRFKTMDDARGFYGSDAYRRARALRHAASETLHLILLRGTDEPRQASSSSD